MTTPTATGAPYTRAAPAAEAGFARLDALWRRRATARPAAAVLTTRHRIRAGHFDAVAHSYAVEVCGGVDANSGSPRAC
ncbi:hypothetical protein [Streptomyces lydicus]|uniref:Uncharacterized protein n=1 Tax=Streptomyces lydicus TaxID=47763 RepID=A0A1D7VK94_9ACTN|nr:hypothetical protein [Streptomyces lydicus]AOP47169.1 hypothetical protein SL103_13685 [Streptomyces lydicus]